MVDLDADRFQFLLENIGGWLSGISCDNHAADVQPFLFIYVDQTDNILIVCDSQIVTDLIALDISGVDRDDHFCLICKL